MPIERDTILETRTRRSRRPRSLAPRSLAPAGIEPIRVLSDALPECTATELSATEGLSSLYRFEVVLSMKRDDSIGFELGDAIGSRATIVLADDARRAPARWHGVFSAFELVHESWDCATYRAELSPRLFELTLDRHSNVFVQKSIPEIVEAVLRSRGYTDDDFELRLAGDYPVREHVCQYRESTFVFLSRLLEREGVYYFFEQDADRERLVITDSAKEAPLRAEPIVYAPRHELDRGEEGLRSFVCRQAALPARVELRDYDYLHPDLDVEGAAAVATRGAGAIALHGENFTTPDDGKRLAAIAAERLRARERVFSGRGRVPGLRPGHVFDLDGHPRGELNASYLVTKIEHVARRADDFTYEATIEAISADHTFRPLCTTAVPRIHGFEAAVVDGEQSSSYAQIDEHGRYLVRVQFDENDAIDGKASTFVRMLQPHGGGREGFHFPLRKGTEVLLAFLGGDPDRPVIAGVAPNANTPSPVAQGNHTRNVIQTGGQNRFELEDEEGSQRLDLSTPFETSFFHLGAKNGSRERNMVVSTDGDGRMRTGTLLELLVGQDHVVRVGGNQKLDVAADRVTTVVKNDLLEVKGNRRMVVTGESRLEVTGQRIASVKSHATESYGADYTKTIEGRSLTSVKGGRDVVITGNDTEEVSKGRKRTHVRGEYEIEADCAFQVKSGETRIFTNDQMIGLTAKNMSIFGPRFGISLSDGAIKLQAQCTIVLECGPSRIVLDESGVKVSGPMVLLNC
jgi:type VI secretion system secreted protein VgrG